MNQQIFVIFIFILSVFVYRNIEYSETNQISSLKDNDKIIKTIEDSDLIKHQNQLPFEISFDIDFIEKLLEIVESFDIKNHVVWKSGDLKFEGYEPIKDRLKRVTSLVYGGAIKDDDLIDKLKIIKMSLIFDIKKAIKDDETIISRISKVEMESITDEFAEFDSKDLLDEYEQNLTLESQFVKDIYKIELMIWAFEYENSYGKNFFDFIDQLKAEIRHPVLRAFVDDIESENSHNDKILK